MQKNKMKNLFDKATKSFIATMMMATGCVNSIVAPVKAATRTTPFESSQGDNLFSVDGYGDLIVSVIRESDGSGYGPLGFCLAKQRKFPHTAVTYTSTNDKSTYVWDRGDGTWTDSEIAKKVDKALYAFNFVYNDKLTNYGLAADDTMSLYHATQIALWSLIEGWSPSDVVKDDDTLADPDLTGLADKIYPLYVDIYNYANGDNPTFEDGGKLLNVGSNSSFANGTEFNLSGTTMYRASNGVTYYRTPLISLIPNQNAGIVFDGSFAYTFEVSLSNAPTGTRIVDENGNEATVFSTDTSANPHGNKFYVEVPVVEDNAGSFDVNVATTNFYKINTTMWNPDDVTYQTLMQMSAAADSASGNFKVSYPALDVAERGKYAEVKVIKEGEQFTHYEDTTNTLTFDTTGLEGVGYKIYLGKDKTVYSCTDGVTRFGGQQLIEGVHTTGSSGTVTFTNLPMDADADYTTYTIEEVSVPNGYYLGEETARKQNVRVDKDTNDVLSYGEITFTNDRVDININNVVKRVEVYNRTDGEVQLVNGEGVTFGLYTDEDITATDGTVLPKDTKIMEYTTGSTGMIGFDDTRVMILGHRYYLKELSVPDTYPNVTMSNDKYYIDLSSVTTDGTVNAVTVNVTDASGSVVTDIVNALKYEKVYVGKILQKITDIKADGTIENMYENVSVEDLADYTFELYSDPECKVSLNDTVDGTKAVSKPDGTGKTIAVAPSINAYPVGSTVFVKESSKPADDNYQLNTGCYSAKVGSYLTAGADVLLLNDLKTVDLKIMKMAFDSTTGDTATLPGVHFDLKYNGNIIAWDSDPISMNTNDDGKITIHDLPVGVEFTLVENVPAGYNPDPNKGKEYTFVVSDSETTIQFDNQKKILGNDGMITINKIDNDTGARIEGAQFSLYESVDGTIPTDPADLGTPAYTRSTDENGQIMFEGLTYGYYIVKEVMPATGYVDGGYITAVEVSDTEKTIILNINNRMIERSVTVYKEDAETHEKLSGAKFQVLDEDGAVLETIVTDASGEAHTSSYKYGTKLTIKEIEAPARYRLDTTPQEVTIGTLDEYSVTFQNEPFTGTMQITKYDADDRNLHIQGAKFKITGPSYSEGIELVTDGNGEIVLEDLKPGTYAVVETEAPEGYELDDTTFMVQIENDADHQVTTVSIANRAIPVLGDIKITKTDAANGALLEGVEFTLYPSDGTIPTDSSEYGTAIATTLTDASGVAKFTGLTEGYYFFVETDTIEGYVLDSTPELVHIDESKTYTYDVTNEIMTASIRVTKKDSETNELLQGAKFEVRDGDNIVATGTTDVNGEVVFGPFEYGRTLTVVETKAPNKYHIDNVKTNVTIGSDDVYDVTFTNTINKGNIKIVKVDEDDLTTKLQGASFKITGPSAPAGIVVTTNVSGEAYLSGLAPGEYVIKETAAPEGYELDPASYTVTINGDTDGETYTVELTNGKMPVITVYGQVKVTKVDSKDETKKLAGAELCLYKEDDTLIECKTTGVDGVVTFTNIEVGTKVYVKEKTAPEGYKLTSDKHEVKVTDSVTYDVKITNEKYLHVINIKKYDNTDRNLGLKGAEFKLCQVTDENCAAPIKTVVTDENGMATITDVEPGKYILMETKAPEGYVLAANNKVTLDGSDNTTTITFNTTFYNTKKPSEPTPSNPTPTPTPSNPEVYQERPNSGEQGIPNWVTYGAIAGGVICVLGIALLAIRGKKEE